MDLKPLVSICCATYNHEPYIRDAIEGFLMQEVDFPIEILINDDASTDRTPDILREYELKYPDLIKVVYQKENQYSKGVRPFTDLLFPRAEGEYIALCEGDDFWTDSGKIQKQVNLLERDHGIAACFHAVTIDYQGSDRIKIVRHRGKSELDLGHYLTRSVFMALNSIVFKRLIIEDTPSWVSQLFAGDFALKYLILAKGNIKYIDENWSVYRRGVPGSWSQLQLTQKRIDREYHDNLLALYKINELTDYRYSNEVIVRSKKLLGRYIGRSITVADGVFHRVRLAAKYAPSLGRNGLKIVLKHLVDHFRK